MKILSKLSLVFIYLVSIFGAIDIITAELKPNAKTELFIFGILAFATQLFFKKRFLVVDIMIVVFAILSSMGFALFISDLIFHPVAVAIDCEGHKPSRTHKYDIMLVGITITSVLGYIFVKTRKKKDIRDKVFSAICIIILILCYLEGAFVSSLNEKIDEVSKPEYVLPKGC